jgi:hypothetical protein
LSANALRLLAFKMQIQAQTSSGMARTPFINGIASTGV